MGKTRRTTPAWLLPAAAGLTLLALLLIFGSCSGPTKVSPDTPEPPISITESEETAEDFALAYAEARTNMGYNISAVEYQGSLANLSNGLDSEYPLTGVRFAECLDDKCTFSLQDASTIRINESTIIVQGTLVRSGISGSEQTPYEATVGVSPEGLVTDYQVAGGGEGTFAP